MQSLYEFGHIRKKSIQLNANHVKAKTTMVIKGAGESDYTLQVKNMVWIEDWNWKA